MPANCIDLRKKHKPSQAYLVDTNVLFWYTYDGIHPAGKEPQYRQSEYYPEYIKRLLDEEAKIYFSTYSISELYHVTERIYQQLINERHTEGTEGHIEYNKELRQKHPVEKQRLDNVFKGMCNDIKIIADPLILIENIDYDPLVSFISDYQLDANDALIYYSMDKIGLNNIVTDDSDFANIDGINLFTTNNRLV